MNTKVLSLAAVVAISAQAQAMSNSNWSVSAGYGVIMPIDAKYDSTDWSLSQSDVEFKQKNASYLDFGITHAKSGFGVMYSGSDKNTKFEATADSQSTVTDLNLDKYIWKYRGYYATYQHPLGQMLDLNIAVGSAKQTFENTHVDTSATATQSESDIAARIGVGAFYNLSKEASIKLSVAYNHFKEFEGKEITHDDNASGEVNTTPKFNASGISASVALVYTM